MKLLALPVLLALSAPAGAAVYSVSDVLTPDPSEALNACVGLSSCDLGFGNLTWTNSTILPAGFSQIGVALAPNNGGAYVGVAAGSVPGAFGTATIVMKKGNVTSFGWAFSSLDSILSDGIGNVLWAFTTTGLYQIGGHNILPLLQVLDPNARSGEFELSDVGYISKVMFAATSNAYEVNHFSVNYPEGRGIATPEASTWLMMLMGFAAIGYAALRGKREKLCLPLS